MGLISLTIAKYTHLYINRKAFHVAVLYLSNLNEKYCERSIKWYATFPQNKLDINIGTSNKIIQTYSSWTFFPIACIPIIYIDIPSSRPKSFPLIEKQPLESSSNESSGLLGEPIALSRSSSSSSLNDTSNRTSSLIRKLCTHCGNRMEVTKLSCNGCKRSFELPKYAKNTSNLNAVVVVPSTITA